jgi:carbamoyltransferase
VMGLAPYGKKNQRAYDLMQRSLVVKGLRIESHPERAVAWTELVKFGRKPDAPSSDAADLAHTVQLFFSDIMSELLPRLYELRISDNLVLGGGCALNSSYNGQVLARTPFRHLHVNSAPADDGNSVGAALLAYQEDHPGERRPKVFQSPYLGSTMSEEVLDNVRRFNPTLRFSTWPNQISKKAAELIAGGAIIGWVQRRAEFGPRALGNRSILADPRPANMKDAINARVKFREEFRPLAPSILHEYGEEYFIDYQESPYMERTLLFREAVRDRVPAVVHVDGSGRLQTVKREWNERYYDLILEFHRITGVPIVLNTSFNVMGKPIVHSVEDAIGVFFTSGLDALIIDDCLIQK